MQHIIFRVLVALLCCLPTLATAATTQSIHVEWGYTPPSAPAVTGYKLYQEGAFACQTQDPNATAMDCQVTLTQQTTNFTLTATFSDGTESPHSAPFAFTSSSGTTPPPTSPVVTETNPNGNTLFTFSWDAPSDAATLQGYRIYLNNSLMCATSDPSTTSVACRADLIQGTMTFGMTKITSTGTESAISNLLTYTNNSAPIVPLQAVISANPLTGTAPLAVSFNASSSTGTIAAYAWDFGDGATATGATTNHVYNSAGTYTAKLTVTSNTGQKSTISATVGATAPVVPATPPTAVISSSTAAGPAPLNVQFNGSGSKAATGATIASYAWSFGDGSSATGASATHTFSTAGTYTTTLTVTDSKGLTNATSTPVVVSTPTATNKAPTAAINATPVSGTAPLTVTLDGSASSDSDGTIAAYTWNFGDGSTATGKTVTHTYTTAATFTATLQITDNQGASGSTSTSIVVQTKTQPVSTLNLEMGEIAVTGNWVRVPLTGTFTNPVVIAGPASFNNSQPGAIRLRNVDKTGFDIKFAEWNYLDGVHPEETVSYLVIEKGRHTLPDGSEVEAGSFAGGTSFKTIAFTKAFATKPVVLTTIASANEADVISGRVKNVATSSFAYYFREQEMNRNTHTNETIGYLAWQPGKGTIGTVQYEAALTANAVTHAWYGATFKMPYAQPPLLLADMQTTNGTDTSALRVQAVAGAGFQVKVEEEQSKDTEVSHGVETVGYLSLNQPEEKVLATLTWEFDAAQEATISGFRLLANGEEICTTNSPTVRELSCEMTKPEAPTAFTIQAIENTGTNSAASNSISYVP